MLYAKAKRPRFGVVMALGASAFVFIAVYGVVRSRVVFADALWAVTSLVQGIALSHFAPEFREDRPAVDPRNGKR